MIEHIDTKDMIADPLTKALSPTIFRNHTNNIGLVSPFNVSR